MGRSLTIKAERKPDHGENETFGIHEIRYGSFERTLLLPPEVNSQSVKATYRNGVLELSMDTTEGFNIAAPSAPLAHSSQRDFLASNPSFHEVLDELEEGGSMSRDESRLFRENYDFFQKNRSLVELCGATSGPSVRTMSLPPSRKKVVIAFPLVNFAWAKLPSTAVSVAGCTAYP